MFYLKIDDHTDLNFSNELYEQPITTNPKVISLKIRKRKFKKRFREEQEVVPRQPVPIHESEWKLCVSLWRSVVLQGLYDISGKGGSFERKMIRSRAIEWFVKGKDGEESDFEMVCSMAGLNPERILKIAKIIREKKQEFHEGINFRSIRKDFSERVGRKVK